MVWFKNAIIYQINNNALFNRDKLEEAVKSVPFTPCGSLDTEKIGWVSPYNDNNQNDFIIDVQGQLLLRIKKITETTAHVAVFFNFQKESFYERTITI